MTKTSQQIRDDAKEACRLHGEEAKKIIQAYQAVIHAQKEANRFQKAFLITALFAIIGHTLIQTEVEHYLDIYLPIPVLFSQILLGIVLLGVFWLTCQQAGMHDPTTPKAIYPTGVEKPWWQQGNSLPGIIYGIVLIALVILGAVSVGNGMAIFISIIGLGIVFVAWSLGGKNRYQYYAKLSEIKHLKELPPLNNAELEDKLEEIVSQKQSAFKDETIVERVQNFDKQLIDQIRTHQANTLPIVILMWLGKIALAIMVAYPGEMAMGELVGWSANYDLGFKMYPIAWIIVSVLLLAAELLFIKGVVEARFAQDAHSYLYSGYPYNHYTRGFMFKTRSDRQQHKGMARTLIVIAIILAAVDLGFNVSYMWDQTGNAGISFLAGGFFTSLLVGLSVLLAHFFEYKHAQLANACENWEEAPRPEVPKQPQGSANPGLTGTQLSSKNASIIQRSRPSARLVARKNGQVYSISRDTETIGRQPSQTIVLPADETMISGEHAILSWTSQGWVLENKGRHGTFVDGKALSDGPSPISPPALIKMGNYEMDFVN